MSAETDAAIIGLVGVSVGAVVSLVGTVVVPWIRDSIDRRRQAHEKIEDERRQNLLSAMDALLQMRQAEPGTSERGAAQARFGAARNRLAVQLTTDEEPVSQVLMLMLAMVQGRPTAAVENMMGQAMEVLTLWVRGDVETAAIITEVEVRAGIKFSEDRMTAVPVNPSPTTSNNFR